jgi:hypothetical protein
VEQHGFVRVAWRLVAAERHGEIEFDVAKISVRTVDAIDPELDEGMPVADGDIDVHQRHLDAEGKSLLLGGGQLRHDVRNDHVVTGKHAVPRLDATEFARAHVAHIDPVAGGASVGDADSGAVQAEADRPLDKGAIQSAIEGGIPAL